MFLTRPTSTRLAHPATRCAQPVQSLFQSSPAVQVLKTRDLFALDGPLIFKSKTGVTITIPPGTVTDFASIPKVLDWVPWLDINGTSRPAGELHDGGYKLDRTRGKDFWDGILLEACLSLGMANYQAKSYYYGVHWCGASSFAADQKNANYGTANPVNSNFVSQETYEAWMRETGGTIYS